MKKVFWISRHEMTSDQRENLEKICGGQVEIRQEKNTVKSTENLVPQIQWADVVAAVLPPELLQQVLSICGEKPLIRAVSQRVATGVMRQLPDGRQEQEFAFAHQYWEQVLKIQVETRRLNDSAFVLF